MGTEKAPYPADTKNKGWRFELDLEQIAQSDTWALAKPDVRPWLLMLWSISWQQIPCGSLPADDEIIAARIGMDLNLFTEKRAMLMRGWYKADDGRLYHPTIAQRVLAMLETKQKEKDRKAAYRERIAGNVPRDKTGQDDRPDGDSRGSDPGCDATGTRTGTGTGTSLKTKSTDNTQDLTTVGIPSKAGAVCVSLRAEGFQSVNPSNPELIELLNSGAQIEDFVTAGRIAKEKGKGFAYVIGIVRQQQTDAKLASQRATDEPAKKAAASPWWISEASVQAKAAEYRLQARPGESLPDFKTRIQQAIDRGKAA